MIHNSFSCCTVLSSITVRKTPHLMKIVDHDLTQNLEVEKTSLEEQKLQFQAQLALASDSSFSPVNSDVGLRILGTPWLKMSSLLKLVNFEFKPILTPKRFRSNY